MKNYIGIRSILAALALFWLIVMLFFMTAANAGEARVSWTAPTERTDGSSLDNLAGYRVLWGTSPRGYTQSAVVMHPTTEYAVTDLPEGTHYFAVTAFDANDLESAPSAEASKTIVAAVVPLPESPSALVVQESARSAYTLVQTADRIVLVPVGIVPAGTSCDLTQAVRDSNGLLGYVVPKDSVTWAGTVRAEVVVAECQ